MCSMRHALAASAKPSIDAPPSFADMLLARLALAMGDEAIHCLLLPATKIAKFFIWSDVVTFALQAAGGGLSTSKTETSQRIGPKVRRYRLQSLWKDALTSGLPDHPRRTRDPARVVHLFHRHAPRVRLPTPPPRGLPESAAAVLFRRIQVLVEEARIRLAPGVLRSRLDLHRHPHPISVPSHRVLARSVFGGPLPLWQCPRDALRARAASDHPRPLTPFSLAAMFAVSAGYYGYLAVHEGCVLFCAT
jgi:hypothetical protein